MSPRFRPKLPAHFTVPQNRSGSDRVLKFDPSVSAYCDLQPPNVWPEHSHPVVQIVLGLDRVECELSWRPTDDTTLTEIVREPHVWIVAADVPHAAEWKGAGAMVVLYVSPNYIREECGIDVTQSAVVSLASITHRDYLIGRLCRKFHDFCHGRYSFSQKLLSASAAVLAPTILKAWLNPGVTSRSPHGLTVAQRQRVSDFIDQHLREPIDRTVLASAIGMAVSHFSRKFKLSTGLAPMQYLWRCRLYRARQLLESGDWKVAAVAAECGFYDQSHLDRQFRKEFHCSPGAVIPPPA